jgi:hypothetical protein
VEQVFEQHEAIVAAVDRCDPDAARAAMAYHIAFYSDILQTRMRERQTGVEATGNTPSATGRSGNGAGIEDNQRSQ